jgi:hypothetical protein
MAGSSWLKALKIGFIKTPKRLAIQFSQEPEKSWDA